MADHSKLRVFDYVNHPYDEVRDVLTKQAISVFQNATLSAAERVEYVAAQLHVNIGGIEIGKNIEITINEIEHLPGGPKIPPSSRISLSWNAIENTAMFPKLWGDLNIYPLTPSETQLDFQGTYEVPFGLVGEAFNSLIGNKLADASVLKFIKDVAAFLRSNIPSNISQTTN